MDMQGQIVRMFTGFLGLAYKYCLYILDKYGGVYSVVGDAV